MEKRITEIMNHETLMTNGLGGYSFGTLDGVNCRKYHGLYTISYNPPIERMHLISKLQEEITVGDQVVKLTTENVTGTENTESALTGYHHEGVIQQTFDLADTGIKVTRTLAMAYGTNHLAVRYVFDAPVSFALKMTPWFNFRDHHDAITASLSDYQALYYQEQKVLKVEAKGKQVYLKCVANEVSFIPDGGLTPVSWYPIETQRGYPDQEAHAVLGHFQLSADKGLTTVDFLVHITPEFMAADLVFEGRKERYEMLMKHADATDPVLRRLVQAADDFIVFRKTTGKMTIIAGYPWFSDWGRDTMIAIPGLTLDTGRSHEALQMIEGFLEMSHQGIIPNNFPDEGEAPMYNTSDGTLWLFNALYAYYEQTADLEAVKRLFPKLMEIINHHLQGTINDIYMDTDGLLSSGNEQTQLTWMDVKVNGWVVTPRHGKAVEINALWYNALCIMEEFSLRLGFDAEMLHVDFTALTEQVKVSFNQAFWNAKDHNLYDLVIDGEPVAIPRPNMIFAVSLPFPVLEKKHWKPVVDYVTKHFKVPYGLLTLRREDENFHEKYEGDLLSRDGAYHRGTAWGWLIGPYLEAHLKTYGDEAFIKASLDELFTHLDEGIHGSISEIFEGGAPHAQRGCSAQAWSVAEAIRLYKRVLHSQYRL